MLIWFWLFFVFVIGLVVGSFLNVCVARLPLEKSLLWPGSRCGNCLQPVRWYDNLPLISYLVLRGRCRTCGVSFSPRYFFVELLTGLGFAGLFYLEVVLNVHQWPGHGQPWAVQQGLYPWQWWAGYGYHALLFSFLMVAAACDLSGREIPLPLTLTGTFVGLVGAACLPWPWPYNLEDILRPLAPNQRQAFGQGPWGMGLFDIPEGLYPWPVWGPLPSWAPPGSWQLGLITGLAGMLAGTFLMRAIGFLFSRGLGKEALGLGDADLMMMAGSFLGWQPIVLAFFLSAPVALVLTAGLAIILLFRTRRTIKVRIGFNAEGHPVFRVAGERVDEKQLATTLDRVARETAKQVVYVGGPNITHETVTAVEQAAKQTPIKRVLVLRLMPFGPALAGGILLTMLTWRWIGPHIQVLFFWSGLLLALAAIGGAFMFGSAYLLRVAQPAGKE
jgi:leader peptidase (prepilin peptidase)/N-methyltransferase